VPQSVCPLDTKMAAKREKNRRLNITPHGTHSDSRWEKDAPFHSSNKTKLIEVERPNIFEGRKLQVCQSAGKVTALVFCNVEEATHD
jgi:hypothetical protein